MSKVFTWLVVCLSVTLLPACNNISSADGGTKSAATPPQVSPNTEPPSPTIDPELLNAQPTELCDRLAEIKKLPYRDPSDTDAIYEALIAKGEQAYPCLVEKITDSKKMPDPRDAPVWPHYAVGDTAVFILVRSVSGENDSLEEKLLLEMLPKNYREEWKTNGVYAYFNYVSAPKNRKELQRWWKNWIGKNNK
jgi:hypothetical protein